MRCEYLDLTVVGDDRAAQTANRSATHSRPISDGAPSLQVFFVADFKDQAYQKKVYAKVAGSWKMPARMPSEGS